MLIQHKLWHTAITDTVFIERRQRSKLSTRTAKV